MDQSEDFGALVARHGVDNRLPIQVGDEVTTYVLGERWPWASLPPHEGHAQELVEYQEAVLKYANGDDDWRVERELTCDCRSRRVVAQVLVHIPSARRWATMKPERVPAPFRSGNGSAVDGWALHGQSGQQPHVGGVASCKGCRKRWVVVSFVDSAELIAVRDAKHGARVAP